MKLIVGLGNPGEKYANTRHNVGFWVVDKLQDSFGFADFRELKGVKGLTTEGVAGNKNQVILLKPQTFMNLSGEAVGAVMRYYKIDPQDVLVVVDDLYHEVGTLRIRKDGSAGGHNGLKSVIAHIGTDFWRYRVGVGPQPENIPAENFVLANLDKNTKNELEITSDHTTGTIMADLVTNKFEERTLKFF